MRKQTDFVPPVVVRIVGPRNLSLKVLKLLEESTVGRSLPSYPGADDYWTFSRVVERMKQ